MRNEDRGLYYIPFTTNSEQDYDQTERQRRLATRIEQAELASIFFDFGGTFEAGVISRDHIVTESQVLWYSEWPVAFENKLAICARYYKLVHIKIRWRFQTTEQIRINQS